MGESVFIIRLFNRHNEYLSIYGVYATLDKAISELNENEGKLEFDEERWLWRDVHTGRIYRIDEYTVVQ